MAGFVIVGKIFFAIRSKILDNNEKDAFVFVLMRDNNKCVLGNHFPVVSVGSLSPLVLSYAGTHPYKNQYSTYPQFCQAQKYNKMAHLSHFISFIFS